MFDKKNVFALLLVSVFFTSPALALPVDLYSGDKTTHVPGDPPTFNGEFGPVMQTYGLDFLRPWHSLTLQITAPAGLIGPLDYSITSEAYAVGDIFDTGQLLVGQSVLLEMGNLPGATPENPIAQWLNVQALDHTGLPIVFGKGTRPDNTGQVPEPATLAMLGLGLGLVGLRRRKKGV